MFKLKKKNIQNPFLNKQSTDTEPPIVNTLNQPNNILS